MSRSVRPRIDCVERRSHERHPTALTAYATASDGQRFACSIRNVSDTGAMLEFSKSCVVSLPSKFDIVLANETRFAVKLIWRKDRQAGVLFCL
jgi:hypothetical protein